MRCWLALVIASTAGCYASQSIEPDVGPDASGTACVHASDCPSPFVCIASACVASHGCVSSRECPGLVCDTTRNTCVECVTTADCSGQRCVEGVCEGPCRVDADCTTGVCIASTGTCADCNHASDCDPSRFCNAMHACVDDVCAGGTNVCVGGSVATCHDDGSGLGAPMACASGACADGMCVAGDAGPPDAGPRDAAALGCRSDALGGIGIPIGTIASASTEMYDPASNATDGDLVTRWTSESQFGWVRLDFPTPIMANGVRFAASADPGMNEMFSVSVTETSPVLASAMLFAPDIPTESTPRPVLPPVGIPLGSYASLVVRVNAFSSWAELAEISILTPDCP